MNIKIKSRGRDLNLHEELRLARALSRMVGFAKEIFVVDSHSSAATVKIIEEFGARRQHLFQNQAKHFEWVLEHVPITAEKVIWLGEDVIAEEDMTEEIRRKLPELPKEITGIGRKRNWNAPKVGESFVSAS
jgi:hypothetical protein